MLPYREALNRDLWRPSDCGHVDSVTVQAPRSLSSAGTKQSRAGSHAKTTDQARQAGEPEAHPLLSEYDVPCLPPYQRLNPCAVRRKPSPAAAGPAPR
jgi:hypothetical protein